MSDSGLRPNCSSFCLLKRWELEVREDFLPYQTSVFFIHMQILVFHVSMLVKPKARVAFLWSERIEKKSVQEQFTGHTPETSVCSCFTCVRSLIDYPLRRFVFSRSKLLSLISRCIHVCLRVGLFVVVPRCVIAHFKGTSLWFKLCGSVHLEDQ